jgi:hypothetical protein
VVFLYLHPVGAVSIGIEAQLGFELVAGGSYDHVRTSCDTGMGSFILTLPHDPPRPGPRFLTGRNPFHSRIKTCPERQTAPPDVARSESRGS